MALITRAPRGGGLAAVTKNLLRRIHTNADKLVHGRLLSMRSLTDLILAHSMPFGGRPHHHLSFAARKKAKMDCFARTRNCLLEICLDGSAW